MTTRPPALQSFQPRLVTMTAGHSTFSHRWLSIHLKHVCSMLLPPVPPPPPPPMLHYQTYTCMHMHSVIPTLENMHACKMLMHLATEILHVLQVGSQFACVSHKQGQQAFAWNRLLRDCKDDEERELKQAEMDASIKALHYQTGQEVCNVTHIRSSIPYAHQDCSVRSCCLLKYVCLRMLTTSSLVPSETHCYTQQSRFARDGLSS